MVDGYMCWNGILLYDCSPQVKHATETATSFIDNVLFADVAQCLPRLSSSEVQLLRIEDTLLFEVKTCSRIKLQLRNAHIHMVYQLDFASSTDEDNIIRTVATKATRSKKSHFTQDCSATRQFWVKWTNNVISGGIGFTPGTKEVMRQTDGSERYGKIVTLANVVTEPKDDNAEFTFYPGICCMDSYSIIILLVHLYVSSSFAVLY